MDASTQPLHVAIKRIDPDLPLPTYATAGSVAFDLYCREDIEIAPRTIGLVPANVIVQTPPGYLLLLTMRSSTPRRKGLLVPQGVGIIDQDYCGEGDELMVQAYNFRDEAVLVLPRVCLSRLLGPSGTKWMRWARAGVALEVQVCDARLLCSARSSTYGDGYRNQ